MLINIQSRGFPLSAALKEYVESRIRLAMERYRDKIAHIQITLFDVNGPKGGEDMRCKISLKPSGLPSIVVQETAPDMYDAINICTHRLKRSTDRYFNRIRQRQKGLR